MPLVVTHCWEQPVAPLCDHFLNLGTSRYSIPTLSKGTWLLYVGYYTEFGLTTVQAPGMVKLAKGESLTDNLSVTYQAPPNGLVEGTVTITGAAGWVLAALRRGRVPDERWLDHGIEPMSVS